jgi:hypothetical protein
MKNFNYLLYIVSITSALSCAAVFLVSIWLDILNRELQWKIMGSLFVVAITCLFILAINYHMKKLSDSRKSKED